MAAQLYEGEHTERNFQPSKIDEVDKRLDGYPDKLADGERKLLKRTEADVCITHTTDPTMYQSSQEAADASTSPNGASSANKFERQLVFLFSDVIVFAAKKKLAGVSTRNLVFRGRIFVHEMRLRNAPANSENRQCTLSYVRQTVDGVDSYTVVFKSPSDKEEWWMGLDDVINEAKREMCFPESDHQILTSRGFASLDDVLRHVRWSPAPGGKVVVADWRNLEVATYDAAAQRLVYRQPRRLVLNAAGADVVEFGTAAFGDDADAAANDEVDDVTSVVATRQHELYARIAPASLYEKLTCQQLLERMQAPGDAVQFLSAARNGVQAALPAAAGRKRAHVLATLEQLQIGAAASGVFLELYGAWLSAGAFDESGVAFVAADEQRRAYLEARLGAVGAAPARVAPLVLRVCERAWHRLFVGETRERRVAAWAFSELERDDVCDVVRGLQHRDGECYADSALLRDDLVRLLLHGGFAPTFVRRGGGWLLRFGDADSAGAAPSVAQGGGGGVVRQFKYGGRTWCFDMASGAGARNDGFVVVRRTVRDGDDVVVRASRPTIQGNCFGLKLHELMTGNAKEIGRDVPRFLTQCIAFLDEHGMDQEGLYRISGSSTDIENARAKYNRGGVVEFRASDVHLVSGLLKLWLRDLREPLCTYGLFNEFIGTIDDDAKPKPDAIKRLSELLGMLPQYERFALHMLMQHLSRVAKNADKNNMSSDNLAIVVGPNVLKSPDANPAQVHKTFTRVFKVIELMIDNVDQVFVGVPEQRKALVDAAKEESQREKEQFLNVKRISEANLERVVGQLSTALDGAGADTPARADCERVLREVLRRANASAAECTVLIKSIDLLAAAVAAGNRTTPSTPRDGVPPSPRSFLAQQRSGRATMASTELMAYSQTVRTPSAAASLSATVQAAASVSNAAAVTSAASSRLSPGVEAAVRPKRSLSIGGGDGEAPPFVSASPSMLGSRNGRSDAPDWNVRAKPSASKPPSRPPPEPGVKKVDDAPKPPPEPADDTPANLSRAASVPAKVAPAPSLAPVPSKSARDFVVANSQLAASIEDSNVSSDSSDDSAPPPPPPSDAAAVGTSPRAHKKKSSRKEAGASAGDVSRMCHECGRHKAKHRVTMKSGEKKLICVECSAKYPPKQTAK